MRFSRLFATALAVASGAALAAPPALTVALTVEKPLVLVPERGSRQPRLEGTLWATVTNTTDRTLKVRDAGEHGAVFVDAQGQAHVVVHPCKCVRDVLEPASAVYELRPGEARRIVVDDWSCGGSSWRPPPAGRYRLEYRVLLAGERPAPPPDAKDASALEARCRRELVEAATWAGAFVSAPVEVTLGPRGPDSLGALSTGGKGGGHSLLGALRRPGDGGVEVDSPAGPWIGGLPDGGLAGTLPKEHIQAVIRSKVPDVRRCYEAALDAGAGPEGKLVVQFVIGPDGSVRSVDAKTDSMGRPDLASCVFAAVRMMRFSRPLGGGTVIVNYPFVFKTAP